MTTKEKGRQVGKLKTRITYLRGVIKTGFLDAWYNGQWISPTSQLRYVRTQINKAKAQVVELT